jgi:hypothetical protein
LDPFEGEGLAVTANPLPKPGETLVYDRARDVLACLNVLPPKVWPQCGETSVAGIAVALGEDKRAAAISRGRRPARAVYRTAPSALLVTCGAARRILA